MGKGFEFINDVKQGRIPREYIPAVEKGVREALAAALWPAIPSWTSRLRCSDGSYHDVDSSEMAFKIAAPWPCARAARKPTRPSWSPS